jgi:hypothetical protein
MMSREETMAIRGVSTQKTRPLAMHSDLQSILSALLNGYSENETMRRLQPASRVGNLMQLSWIALGGQPVQQVSGWLCQQP